MSEAWRPGDIVACWGTGATSRIISLGTASVFGPRELRLGPSHVAIIASWQRQPVWIESTSLCHRPCLIRGGLASGCQAHQPEERVNDYLTAGGKVAIYRLTPTDSLSADESDLLTRILVRHFVLPGLCYDTAGAILSGTRLLKWSRLAPGADLHSLFCSELIAKMYMRLGRLNRDNPTRFNPSTLCRQLVREGAVELVDVMRGGCRMEIAEAAVIYGLLLWGCWLCVQCLCEFIETTAGALPAEKPPGTDIARRTGTSAGEVP